MRVDYTAEDGLNYTEECRSPTSPRMVRHWALNALERSGGDARFSVNDCSLAFVPVSTWHGDPVCVVHLTECVSRENGWRR